MSEPEITDLMIAAGEDMIAEKWGVVGNDVAADLARDVFNAMWAARPLAGESVGEKAPTVAGHPVDYSPVSPDEIAAPAGCEAEISGKEWKPVNRAVQSGTGRAK